MIKTAFSALAVCTAGSLGHASETEDWLGLDKELESFSSAVASSQNSSGVGFDGFFRSSYTWGDESDVSAIGLDNVRLNWEGRVEDFDIVLQYEASTDPQFGFTAPLGTSGAGIGVGGLDGLLDAYASWNFQEEFKLTFGQFRPAVLHSSWLDEDELFFYDRTLTGFAFALRDQGLMLSGNFEQIGWWVGAQNGIDGAADDYSYFARVEFDAMGDGSGNVEGAMGSTDELELTVGGAIYVDDALDDGTVWALDAHATISAFSMGAEIVGWDDDFTTAGDSQTTWNVQGTFMFVPDEWEAGVRFQDMDEIFGDDVTIFTVAIAHYLNGHNAKLQAAFNTIDADGTASALDTESFQLGVTLGW